MSVFSFAYNIYLENFKKTYENIEFKKILSLRI